MSQQAYVLKNNRADGEARFNLNIIRPFLNACNIAIKNLDSGVDEVSLTKESLRALVSKQLELEPDMDISIMEDIASDIYHSESSCVTYLCY